jgi:hypothetical protein
MILSGISPAEEVDEELVPEVLSPGESEGPITRKGLMVIRNAAGRVFLHEAPRLRSRRGLHRWLRLRCSIFVPVGWPRSGHDRSPARRRIAIDDVMTTRHGLSTFFLQARGGRCGKIELGGGIDQDLRWGSLASSM